MIRIPLILLYMISGKFDMLTERAIYTEIGYTGNISTADRDVARKRKLAPLSSFEKWLIGPTIEAEKKRRRKAFREATIGVADEDPSIQ